MTWFVEQVHRDGSVAARFAVLGPDFHIGRALDNQLVVDDPHCAPHHASLRVAADGTATLHDLGTINGISPWRGPRAAQYHLTDTTIFRLGNTSLRIRNSAWPMAPERALSRWLIWPFALLMLTLALVYSAWLVWLGDVGPKSPPYLSRLVAIGVGLAIWSSVYALLGRLINGTERFFTHLLIASCGFLVISLVERLTKILAFSMDWLWPMRIEDSLLIVMVAFLVRAHLRIADPRHWPTMRWAVGLGAALALIVPVAQLWISSDRLTTVQALAMVEHPALRLAKPVPIEALTEASAGLKERVDAARRKEASGESVDDDN